MSDEPTPSVGQVAPATAYFDTPLELACGRRLDSYELKYETYGTLNQARTNAILVCHALTGNHHAAGWHPGDRKPGWWEAYIGPGKPIDTNRFFVIAPNNLGGCDGSTGPNSINPETGRIWGPTFPLMTVTDWVESQARLADQLGIERFAAVIGGSLGGMQAIQWSISYPERVSHTAVIAATPKLSAQNIAFNEVARQAIRSDHDFHDGWYQEQETAPHRGLRLARMVGHITYLSELAMGNKFGRDMRNEMNYGYDIEFEVESYLRYQGKNFSTRFDANTYLLMTKALDYFDPAGDADGDLAKALEPVQSRFLVISFTTDWRFAPARSQELVEALVLAGKRVSYANIDSAFGHDAFLLPHERYEAILGGYLAHAADQLSLSQYAEESAP